MGGAEKGKSVAYKQREKTTRLREIAEENEQTRRYGRTDQYTEDICRECFCLFLIECIPTLM
jgi:hypothetical protein